MDELIFCFPPLGGLLQSARVPPFSWSSVPQTIFYGKPAIDGWYRSFLKGDKQSRLIVAILPSPSENWGLWFYAVSRFRQFTLFVNYISQGTAILFLCTHQGWDLLNIRNWRLFTLKHYQHFNFTKQMMFYYGKKQILFYLKL